MTSTLSAGALSICRYSSSTCVGSLFTSASRAWSFHLGMVCWLEITSCKMGLDQRSYERSFSTIPSISGVLAAASDCTSALAYLLF